MGWKEPDNKDRDPWDGHSDLDELLAQFKERWGKRFGGGSGPFRPRIWWVVIVILIGVYVWRMDRLDDQYGVGRQEERRVTNEVRDAREQEG